MAVGFHLFGPTRKDGKLFIRLFIRNGLFSGLFRDVAGKKGEKMEDGAQNSRLRTALSERSPSNQSEWAFSSQCGTEILKGYFFA
jgi:hypothetical protein